MTQKGQCTKRAYRTLEAQEGRAGTLSNQFASILAPAGFRRRQIGAGHDSQQMSAHYSHVGFPALERAAAVFPEV